MRERESETACGTRFRNEDFGSSGKVELDQGAFYTPKKLTFKMLSREISIFRMTKKTKSQLKNHFCCFCYNSSLFEKSHHTDHSC